jgi:hypothetical protein
MLKHSLSLSTALAVLVGLAACGGQKAANADSASMAMANAPTTTQPALGDTAAANAATTTPTPAKPRAQQPAAAAPAPAAEHRPMGTIAAGTVITLHPADSVCTNTNTVGQTIEATVAEAVHGSEEAVIPAGARVELRITALKRSENVKDPIDIGLDPVSVSFDGRTLALSAEVTAEKIDRVRNEPTSKDVQKIAVGAAVGAIAGKLIGKTTKGAVIGGVAGAAAGAGVAATTANFEGCIARGSDITIKLKTPVEMR